MAGHCPYTGEVKFRKTAGVEWIINMCFQQQKRPAKAGHSDVFTKTAY
ncbi:unnamed protein product [Ectocarpus sp. 6 AP-2014]